MPNFAEINLEVINGQSFDEVGEGSLCPITQTVSFIEYGEGSLCPITQNVYDSGSGSLCVITQLVRDTTQATFFQRNGWYCHLYINGYRIPDRQIHGDIKIVRVENDAAQMSFTLIPPRGEIDLGAYEGKSVILNIQTANGLFRAYTGKVNIPDLDLIQRKLTISCTDNRRELINARLATITPYIGYYSENIFGVAKDTADEIDNRLTTIPMSINFDQYAIGRFVNDFAAATPHYVFDEDDIYRDNGKDPRVVITPRAKVVNTVTIDYEYRYQRMYYTEATYVWGTAIDCDFLTKGYSLTRRDLVSSAAESAGWPIKELATATDFQSGFYNCGGVTTGFSWVETEYTNTAKTESYRDGTGQLQTRNVTDSKGNTVYEASPTSYIDHSLEYCDSATWKAYYRWSQNVAEKYTLTVTAPQSVSRYGVVSQSESAGLDSGYDSSRWNDLKNTYYSAPSNAQDVVTNGTAFYWVENSNYDNYLDDLTVLLNKAQTTILKSHRENRVIFNTFIKPEIDLRHTVQVDAVSSEGTEIHAKGKVYQITHTLSPSTGDCNTEIELALSITQGSQTTDTLVLPTRPTNNITPQSFNLYLGSIYGQDPALHPEWTGFIGNAYITTPTAGGGNNTYRTQYPESFVVDTPKINTMYTDVVEMSANQTYDVGIVNDDLEVIL